MEISWTSLLHVSNKCSHLFFSSGNEDLCILSSVLVQTYVLFLLARIFHGKSYPTQIAEKKLSNNPEWLLKTMK